MSSSKRIPRNSVSSTHERIVLSYIGDIEENGRPKKTPFEEREESLSLKEEALRLRELELEKLQGGIEETKKQMEEQYEKNLSELEVRKKEFETQKRRDYYDMREYMWEQAIAMTEKILHQVISHESFSVNESFKGMLKELPIAFEELEITVHPETLQELNKDKKNAWIFDAVNWKYDYSMEAGEFIVEEEAEYFDYRFSSIFGDIRQRLEEKNEEVRSEDDDK